MPVFGDILGSKIMYFSSEIDTTDTYHRQELERMEFTDKLIWLDDFISTNYGLRSVGTILILALTPKLIQILTKPSTSYS